MLQHLTATPHLSVAEFEARYRQAREPVARGQSPAAIAANTGCCVDWVRTVIHRYNDGGPALGDRRHGNLGAPPLDAAGQAVVFRR